MKKNLSIVPKTNKPKNKLSLEGYNKHYALNDFRFYLDAFLTVQRGHSNEIYREDRVDAVSYYLRLYEIAGEHFFLQLGAFMVFDCERILVPEICTDEIIRFVGLSQLKKVSILDIEQDILNGASILQGLEE